ncbi:hypothetical protein FF098_014400 [Parvularcula flava]|uniref:Uncharacterized protein n=1 Tax=Aquisalinus luteolus TaxID=1566827 RepID=A0A8J3A3G8_9PROT|nr:hypothetical protein [Aquisalinus luteolus]NHK29110.1 hypothetical protein [Aquisalinus luteolus]GGI00275.1 hypothetical protein GCM10011355_28180 [Aquisalinus luteolus]
MADSEDKLKPAFLATAASGATLLAVVSFSGALWPYSPNETAQAHLAFANAVAFIGFLAVTMIWCSGALLRKTALVDQITAIANLAAVLVFFICMIFASIQVTESMNAWFEAPPRMPPWLIRLTQIVMLVGLIPLICALFWRLLAPVFRLFGSRKR